MLPPSGGRLDHRAQFAVAGGDFCLEPDDVRIAARLDGARCHPQAGALAGEDGDDLATAGEQGGKGLALRIGRGADRLGEVGEGARIQGVGLRQSPGGAGEVAHLARVDDGDPHARLVRGSGDEPFPPARRFEDDEGGARGCKRATSAAPPAPSLVVDHGRSPGVDRQIEVRFRHIDADEDAFLGHALPTRRPPLRIQAWWPRQLCVLIKERRDAPRCSTTSRTGRSSACRAPHGLRAVPCQTNIQGCYHRHYARLFSGSTSNATRISVRAQMPMLGTSTHSSASW